MAKQVITKLLDDLDGGDADETVTFALDGMGYQIDLSSKNSKKLRDFLDPYLSAATRTGRIGSPVQLQKHRPTVSDFRTAANNREQNQLIREWAVKNGIELAERGRIPQHIQDAYHNRSRALPEPEEAPAASEQEIPPAPTPRSPGTVGAEVKVSGRQTAAPPPAKVTKAAAAPKPRRKAAPAKFSAATSA